jgi:hypothetical protein
VGAGIDVSSKSKDTVKDQALESGTTWKDLDLVKLESEAFLLGIWKDYNELEESISMPELSAILASKRENDYEEKLPENKFLKQYKFVDDKLRLVNKEGKLVDEKGRLIDNNGRFINETGQFVDKNGNLVDDKGDYVVEFSPFLDDNGKPVVIEIAESKKTEEKDELKPSTEESTKSE